LFSEYHIRFELGKLYEYGSEERIYQVLTRVVSLFEETFKENDIIYLYIKDWTENDNMFGNYNLDYVYSLISKFQKEEKVFVDHEETEQQYKIASISGNLYNLPYKEILKGIANYEQGRAPSIGQRIYFVCPYKNIMFYMYDDRGCIIYSTVKDKLKNFYFKFNDWLDDYYRDYFSSIYES
jgi:hypothetical protein